LRVLVASAIILARQKQERRCQDTLASANEVFRLDSQDRVNSVPAVVREEGWRQQQIDSAVVVSNNYPFYRADELIGTEVRDPRDALLGNVADVIQVRQSGKIAYLIIDRGSVFGFAGKPVAVPWADFRITPTASLLVLDTTQVALDQAPSGYDRYPKTTAAADLQAKQIDAYWSAH
jgi:sporulation protein YlmC with PRC-barrel domain